MKLAAIQMCSGADVAANIAAASVLIREAAAAGAKFVATPEMTHLLQGDPDALRGAVRPMAEDAGVREFGKLAAQLGIDLLIGSLAILREDGRIANRSFLFGPDGNIRATYDKINLFEASLENGEAYRESDSYAAGDRFVMTEVDNLKLGLSICYDLRFPALYAGYGKSGAHLITVPAAFTVPTGRAHWETLLRARAIETGAYILAPAQGGRHADGRQTWGRSMLVSPWGEILSQLDHDQPEYFVQDIDLARVAEARARIPAWSQQ